MNLPVEVRLVDLAAAAQALEGLCAGAVKGAIRKALGPVQRRVGEMVAGALEQSPEWDSILAGTLRQEFGLAEPAQALREVREAVLGAVRAEATSPPGSIGGMLVTVLPEPLERQLAAAQAYPSKGGAVDWLSWLLFAGRNRVVADARLQTFRRPVEQSRAGFALMVKNGQLGYSVDPEFAGDLHGNWFTRVLTPLVDPVLDVMLAEVGRAF
jgi:hypothetical protein